MNHWIGQKFSSAKIFCYAITQISVVKYFCDLHWLSWTIVISWFLKCWVICCKKPLWQEFSWSLCSSRKLQSIRPQKFGAIQYSYVTNCKWTSITATMLYDYLTVCAPINLIISSQLNCSVYCWLPKGAGGNNVPCYGGLNI